MDQFWLISAALLLSIYSLLFFGNQISKLLQDRFKTATGISLILLVKDQERLIEGLVQSCNFGRGPRPLEIVAVNWGSGDQTGLILERLARKYQNLRYIQLEPAGRLSDDFCQHCGQFLYCFNLTGPVKFHVIADAIRVIINRKAPIGPKS